MTPSLRELLLGYQLGVLDDHEEQLVARRLEHDPAWRRELARLRRELAPLEAGRRDYEPPPGLAAETCRFVFASAGNNLPPKPAKPLPGLSPIRAYPGWIERIHRADVAVAAAVAVVLMAMLAPALLSNRFHARLIACQDNLRELGHAMTRYSQVHQDLFPALPAAGALRTPGVFAPILVQAGLLRERTRLLCPGAMPPPASSAKLYSIDELQQLPAATLEQLRPTLGGSYGYHPGHLEQGQYRPTRNLRRSYFALMADAPSLSAASHLSLNHDGRGQNVLFEDEHVCFLTTACAPEINDDFFVNAEGRLDLGVHREDSAILPAAFSPAEDGCASARADAAGLGGLP